MRLQRLQDMREVLLIHIFRDADQFTTKTCLGMHFE
nr:MAG TPA: hypothetical protein [Caudoviricetes sp.]